MDESLRSFVSLLDHDEQVVAVTQHVVVTRSWMFDCPPHHVAKGTLVVTTKRLAIWGEHLTQWRWPEILRVTRVDSGRALVVIAGRNRSMVITVTSPDSQQTLGAVLRAITEVAGQVVTQTAEPSQT